MEWYQEMEFTVENMKLYVLETTKAPRTPQAALRIATSLVEENILTAREALLTVDPEHMTFFTRDATLCESGKLSSAYRLCRIILQLQDLRITGDAKLSVMGTGNPSSAGAVVGAVVFTNAQAEQSLREGTPCIFVQDEVTPVHMIGLQVRLTL
jgi:pyruvate, orthophosphate dikinase